MLSLRACWLLDAFDASRFIVARRFPTVERRAAQLSTTSGIPYKEIDGDGTFLTDLIKTLTAAKRNVPVPGSSMSENNLSKNMIVSISGVWPVLYKESGGVVLICVPLIHHINLENPMVNAVADSEDGHAASRLHLFALPCITAAFSFLDDFARFFFSLGYRFDKTNTAKLYVYLSTVCPFGSPVASEVGVWKQMHGLLAAPIMPVYGAKAAAAVSIVEIIDAALYARDDVQDKFQAAGEVSISAIENESPNAVLDIVLKNLTDITIGQVHHAAAASTYTNKLQKKGLFSAAVKDLPKEGLALQVSGETIHSKLPFFKYNIIDPSQRVPLRGFLQVVEQKCKEDGQTSVKLMLQLLPEAAQQSGTGNHTDGIVFFETLEVFVPFPSRGRIFALDLIASRGSVGKSAYQNSVTWNIGSKAKIGEEMRLQGTIQFEDAKEQTDSVEEEKVAIDPLTGRRLEIVPAFRPALRDGRPGDNNPMFVLSNCCAVLKFKICNAAVSHLVCSVGESNFNSCGQ